MLSTDPHTRALLPLDFLQFSHVDNFPETSFYHTRARTRFESSGRQWHTPVNDGRERADSLVRITRRERDSATHTTVTTATAKNTFANPDRRARRLRRALDHPRSARDSATHPPSPVRSLARSLDHSLIHSHARSGVIRRRTTLAGPPSCTPRLPPLARNEGVRWGGINMRANAGNSRAGPSPPSTRWIHTHTPASRPPSLPPTPSVSCVLYPHFPRLSYHLHPRPPFFLFFFISFPPLCFP